MEGDKYSEDALNCFRDTGRKVVCVCVRESLFLHACVCVCAHEVEEEEGEVGG